MPDSTIVLNPGWRALDANGDPYSGGILKFFEALGTTPRTVYSNAALSSSLGTEVTCDSGGYPTSNGNAKCLVYTGTNPFKVELYTSTGDLVWSHDLVTGALDTSGFGDDAVAGTPVVTVSTDQTINLADKGNLYNVNCSGGDVQITLAAATTLGDNWRAGFRHNGSANQVKFVTTGGDLIGLPGVASTTAFSLTSRGQEIWLRCDGGGFSAGETAPAVLDTTGIWRIKDRLSAPPGSPEAGARYILLTTPTGDWATFSQHDIAEANGQGGWIRHTPATDCGWVAYVEDEDILYYFLGSAWTDNIATQALMEAAASLTTMVTPGAMKWHPGVAKAWLVCGTAGNIFASHGVASIVDNGTGQVTVTWSQAFSSINYLGIGNCLSASGVNLLSPYSLSWDVGFMSFFNLNGSATAVDPSRYFIAAFGDV